ncbi:MAG: phage holin family protein [Bradyrhizobium sp.]|nr:phage holin family protein [Bradyrhizobium sp.]
MPALSSGLLRAGLALKLNQVKRATNSYLRDRTNQATGTATSYAVAAGMFAAAGIFLIAALLVGAAALFRWIEINYGLFPAFGATGGLLVAIAAICAGAAASRLKRPAPQFPSLASRLRVAINANPIKPARVEAATDTATQILREPATPVSGANRAGRTSRPGLVVDSRKMQAGLLLAATLLGWAAVRRQQARRTAP